ncbi:MAG: hypothetical protein II936_09510 [Oscillospiraceae bacterium]|jgi:cell division protein FtsB|nr:hypothetical protein [Oscillospiraceae bacterium]
MAGTAVNVARYEEFEEHRRIREEAHPKMIVTRRSQAPVAIKAVFCIGVCVLLFAVAISSLAENASMHEQIVQTKAQLSDLKQENARMVTAIEEKSSQKAVEDYAENVLGMQKFERSQAEYISIESGNVVEIAEKDESFSKKITYKIEEFIESLKGEK